MRPGDNLIAVRTVKPNQLVGETALITRSIQSPDEVLRQVKHRLRALRGSENFGFWSGDSEFRKMQNFNAGFAALFADETYLAHDAFVPPHPGPVAAAELVVAR